MHCFIFLCFYLINSSRPSFANEKQYIQKNYEIEEFINIYNELTGQLTSFCINKIEKGINKKSFAKAELQYMLLLKKKFLLLLTSDWAINDKEQDFEAIQSLNEIALKMKAAIKSLKIITEKFFDIILFNPELHKSINDDNIQSNQVCISVFPGFKINDLILIKSTVYPLKK